MKETIEALNKHQSEAKNTISKEINELRAKIDNIKERVNHDMEDVKKEGNRNTKQKWKANPAD
jgi:molecular chaperone GrpE (heat shock protein)